LGTASAFGSPRGPREGVVEALRRANRRTGAAISQSAAGGSRPECLPGYDAASRGLSSSCRA